MRDYRTAVTVAIVKKHPVPVIDPVVPVIPLPTPNELVLHINDSIGTKDSLG